MNELIQVMLNSWESETETDNDSQIDLSDTDPQRKLHGTVTKTIADRSYGFIQCIGVDEDYFRPLYSAVLNQMDSGPFLNINDKVEFTIAPRNNQWQAKNVIVIREYWIETPTLEVLLISLK